MRNCVEIIGFAALLFCSVVGVQAAETGSGGRRLYGDAQRGKEYAERMCTSCHAIGAAGTDGAPALALLKKDPKKTDAYIRGFLVAPHKPMPPMAVTTQEIEDLVAYILGPI